LLDVLHPKNRRTTPERYTFSTKLVLVLQSFIFSNKPNYRLSRHLAFWAVYYLHTVLTDLPNAKIKTFISPAVYIYAWHDAFAYLPVYLFGVYVSLYFILPRYLAKRNIAFLCLTASLLLVLSTFFSYVIATRKDGLYFEYIPIDITGLENIDTAVQKGIVVFFMVVGWAVILKIMKDYALRQRENETLALNGIRNNLRLLKMQMHPTILFASLHAIAADIETGSAYAPEMILRLSDLLSYLLYETESRQVTLAKELAMIQNYMVLKKREYQNNLRLDFKKSGNMNAHAIAPALLLPLLETGLMRLGNADAVHYVSIELKTEVSLFYFSLKSNMQGVQLIKSPAMQTILQRVKETLQLSYPDKFKLGIHPGADSFDITLQLRLNPIDTRRSEKITNPESHIDAHP
jgi:sensor histidine kinase YesM